MGTLGGAKKPRAGSCKSASSLSRSLASDKGDLEDIIGPKSVAQARFFQSRPWPQTEVMAKGDEIKDKYLIELADPLDLKFLEL